jgi:uncharacterized protein YigA (DUF484 family)
VSTDYRASTKPSGPSERAVGDYLLAHPEFFAQHTELLTKLRIPHVTGGAASLIERQVALLRKQNDQLERKLVELVEVARANDSLLERIHHLAVALLESDDLEERLIALQDILRSCFGADELSALLFRGSAEQLGGAPAKRIERADPALGLLHDFLQSGKPKCGRFSLKQLHFLFGTRATHIGSAALVGLGTRAELGLLAIGSRNPEHFAPTLGTAFLTRIGELTSAAIGALL